MTNEIDDLLSFDPLYTAEKLTGKSYDKDPATAGLGFLLIQEAAERKRTELGLRGDTYRDIPFTEAIDVALDMGFKVVWVHSGVSHYGNPQKTVILWDRGILLTMNDYRDKLNSAYIFFNWRPTDPGVENAFSPAFQLPISGGMRHRSEGFDDVPGDPWVMVSNIHVVEGLKHRVEQVRASGVVLEEWYITDSLLHVHVGKEVETDFSDRDWLDKIRQTTRARVAEFAEPARSAIEAGMFGKDWE